MSEAQLRQEIQQAENPVVPQPLADAAASSKTKNESSKICGFATTQTPSHKDIIINEVAWMGSVESSANEWIEIKNISGAPVDATGWQLIDMDGELKASLSGAILAEGFYLLERTDDNSVPGVNADQIYTGSLENAGEGLRLFDPSCNLVDEVMASPDWPAGDNSYKKTAERQSDFSWRNYNGDSQKRIFLTPPF